MLRRTAMVRKLLSSVLALCFASFTAVTGCAGPTLYTGPRGSFAEVDKKLKEAHQKQQQATRILAREDVRATFETQGFRALESNIQNFVESNTNESIQDDAEAYEGALQTCKTILSTLEEKSTGFRWGVFSIAILGSLAGAVLIPAFNTAPIANKALVSGLGGVSGIANTAQHTLVQTGLTSGEVNRQREAIRQKFVEAVKAYEDASKRTASDDPHEKLKASVDQSNAVLDMKVACTAYAVFDPDVSVE